MNRFVINVFGWYIRLSSRWEIYLKLAPGILSWSLKLLNNLFQAVVIGFVLLDCIFVIAELIVDLRITKGNSFYYLHLDHSQYTANDLS